LKFGVYDEDDIHQEIFLLVLRGESSYDPSKGDEFLFYLNFVKNRLITLKRDTFVNMTIKNPNLKMALNNASSIVESDKLYNNEDVETIDGLDLLTAVVDNKIPANMRINYLKLLDGTHIDWHDRLKLSKLIKNIIEVYDEKEE